VSEVLARHLRQQQEQGSISQPAAAAVLQYCLSDASPPASTAGVDPNSRSSGGGAGQLQFLQAVQQLNGLKLLPLDDGQLQAVYAGLHTDQGPAAANRLSSHPVDCAVYVTVSSDEQQLLQRLPYHVMHAGVPLALRQQLQVVAAAGASNIHVLTAARFDSHILGLLMPPGWHSSRGHVEVTWQPEQQLLEAAESDIIPSDAAHGAVEAAQQQQQQQQQPSKAFIRLCWQWLADRADAAEVRHWPLLPVTGSKLRLLQQPAQVRACNNMMGTCWSYARQ
jgi:hypothetical protein